MRSRFVIVDVVRKKVGETSFHPDTPDDLIKVLLALHTSRERIVIVYGNVLTGERWDDLSPNRGTLGRSTGTDKILLLVRTKRSFGGEALLDHCILEIRSTSKGKLLYQRLGG